MEWTKEQKQAIYEKESNILVAAAAGSGKTAVLVERIINKVVNENIDIDKILVVTFTNAAASEMRERILESIYKKIEEEPENENLQRQITLLNKASICTIDSFCLEVVRNNFYELENISPNFRIADTAEIELLKQEVIEEIFEEKYEIQSEDFTKLITTYTSYRDDSSLKEIVQKIYTYIQSNPFPEKWLKEKIEMFNLEQKTEEDFSNTIWGNILLEQIEEILIEDISKLQEVEKQLSYDIELDVFQKVIQNDIDNLNILKENLDNWDKAYTIFNNIEFVTWPRKKVEKEIKEIAKIARDNIKKNYIGKTAKIGKILIDDSKQANLDILDMYKILKKLEELIFEYGERFSKLKREKNIVDFNDIEHLALEILLTQDENEKTQKSQIAKKYQEKYTEIAIDEYQDSNLVQEYILTSISNEKNMFMVGDVKQSIYKFRQAMPELFLKKYREYKDIKERQENQDLKIQLFKNFRSRKNVLDFTNLIFENIMSGMLGDIEYTKEEFLNLGANYEDEKQDLKTEIDVIDISRDDVLLEQEEIEDNQEERIEDVELEARFVADKIQKLVQDKFQVYDNKKGRYRDIKYRDIKYRDIVILLRSTSNAAKIYEQELLKLQMPVFSDTSNQYLDSIEIETIMALLRIIDNPLQDIPLITLLRSTIGGFLDDELVEIRLVDKYDNFYNCLLKAKLQVNEEIKNKINNFLKNLDTWRNKQEYLALDELIWLIYTDTGYYNYVGLMPNGELRRANLKLLFEKAKQYEKANFKGLYNFIKFVEKLKLNNGDLNSAKIIGENDNVIRIMSIHKSKGLEFPVVFLASTGKAFNLMDLNKNILLHQDLGIGVKYIDYEKQIEYDTLTKAAIKNAIFTENLSEEMRILYVALTRAKEKLIITATIKDYEKKNIKMEEQKEIYKRSNNKINPILLKKYKKFIDWILLVSKYEENNLEEIMKINIFKKQELLKQLKEVKEEKKSDIEKELNKYQINMNDLEKEKIKQKLQYEYPFKNSISVITKTSVSEIKKLKNQDKKNEYNEIDFQKPNFLNINENETITGSRKGTLIHLCMQKLNRKIDYDLDKIRALIKELEETGIITKQEQEAINPFKIFNFINSKIWQEVNKAKKVYREKTFYINIPANEIYENGSCDEVLVQGIIDLYYIDENDNIILVDYKTDYVENRDEKILIEKYKTQLELYKKALEKSLNKNVNKVYIYSTYLDKEIEIS